MQLYPFDDDTATTAPNISSSTQAAIPPVVRPTLREFCKCANEAWFSRQAGGSAYLVDVNVHFYLFYSTSTGTLPP